LKEATMKAILTGALAALTIGGALAATTLPAAAEGRHGYGGGYGGGWHDRDRGDRGNDAAAAGLFGLAIGAALAGGTSYGYGYAPGYYAAPSYYVPPPRCRVEMRWNPAYGTYDRVRVCY
jgi:hypothetical protein